ncbi:MAG: hypothetical protein A2075_00465 [Geobacteraceae bacterium GWC2_58_44]|nr:MAG: hypothetical protein A2075_00465 [Geobacteraceae bacterium GWC2_58_44]HBG06429.1 hypothetical protein [Geobacter sp.]
MMSYRMPTCRNRRATLAGLLLVVALFSAGVAQAASQYNLGCDDCHTMPPLDTPDGSRDPANGAFKGNHKGHSTETAASCVPCHGAAVLDYAAGHRTPDIKVQGNLNNSPLPASYDRTPVNQSPAPPVPLGRCSNVNCHFESQTPAWGETSYAAPADCGSCHGLAPNDGSHPSASGAGKKHGDYYGTGTDSCAKCHPDHKNEELPFAHANSAGLRPLLLRFDAAPNSGGSYSKPENLAYPSYLPSQTAAASRNGDCSDMYCHSNGLAGGAPLQAAVWGGSLRADCTGCHGGNASSSSVIASGSHAEHVQNVANLGTNYACGRCHISTSDPATDLELASGALANHVNGSAEVLFSEGGNYGALSCSATICHAAGKAGAPQPAPLSWGGAALSCSGCHGANGGIGGFASRFGEPNYQNAGTVAAELANSHGPKHVTSALSCVDCHATTTGDGVTILNGSTLHTDGAIAVSFPAIYDLGGAGYDDAIGAKSCSNTYCHSDGNGGAALELAQWGGRSSCRSCHGGDAASGAAVATFQHPAHLKNYSTLGRGNELRCAECHAQTSAFANNTTLGNPAYHLNRFKDYSGIRAGGSAGYSNRVCSNVYCHSTGEATPVFRNMTGSKAWDGSAQIGCDGCHGYGPGSFAPVAGEPNYPSRAGAENSHQSHVAGAGMADSRGCAICHRSTVDRGVANRLRDYSSAHLNGVREVSFAVIANYSGQYLAQSKGCSNTYCHGVAPSAPWGAPGTLSCNDCHRSDATLAGQHGSHWEGAFAATSYTAPAGNLAASAAAYNFECTSCHGGAHSGGPASSNNAAEVFFNYTAQGLSGSYSYGGTTAVDGTLQWSNGSCSATYCHSKGDGSEGFGSATMNWGSPERSLSCNGCHGGDFSKGDPIDTGLHRNHLDPASNASLGAGNGLNCGDCHAQTMGFANNTTVSDKRRHVNKFLDYSGALAGGSANYDRADKSCSDIYCHSNGKRGTAQNQFRNPAPWSVVTSYGCNDCHGQADSPDFFSNPALGAPNYANSGAPGESGSNSHKVHLDKMGIAASNACYVCHAKSMDRNAPLRFRPYSTAHLSGAANVSFGAFSSARFKLMSSVAKASYSAATRSCSTLSCHSDGKGGYREVKWGAAGNCAMCHPLNKLSRGHAFHLYTSAANEPTFYDNYTANRSNSGVAPGRYNYGCAACHPVDNPNHTKGLVLIDLYPGSADVVGLLRSKNGSAITTGRVPAGTPGSGTTVAGNTLTCDNVYCHSNGYAAAPVYAVTPDWYNGSFSGDRCSNCHGNWPNSSIAGSPSHYNNNWMGTGESGGHAVGIHANSIADGAQFTGLATPGTSDMASHGNAAYSTTISCNTCHWATVRSAVNGGSNQCTSACHTVAANKGSAVIFDKSMHVSGKVQVGFESGLTFRSKAQVRDSQFAAISSATLWHRNGSYKIAGTGSHDSSKLPLSVSSYAGGNCSNVVCHFNKPVSWSVTPGSVSCQSCHQAP